MVSEARYVVGSSATVYRTRRATSLTPQVEHTSLEKMITLQHNVESICWATMDAILDYVGRIT